MRSSGSTVVLLLAAVSTALALLCPSPSVEASLSLGGPLLPAQPSTTTLDVIASSSSPSSSSLVHLFPPSGLVFNGIVVAGFVLPPPPRQNPASPPSSVRLELRSASGVVQDAHTVFLGGDGGLEPAPFLLYSSFSSDETAAGLPGACPAPLMLKATATPTTTKVATTKVTKKAKKGKLAWSRALSPSGSAAQVDVDWVGSDEEEEEEEDEIIEEEKAAVLVVAVGALAFAAGAAVAAALLLLLLLLPSSQARSSENNFNDEEEEEQYQNQHQHQQREAKPRWAREGGAGRLSKVSGGGGSGGYHSPSL